MDFMNMFQKEEDHALDRFLGAAAGITAGIGLMYILDPSMGRQRRSMIMGGVADAAQKASDGMHVAMHRTTETVSGAAEKVVEGAKSVAEKATSMFSGDANEQGRGSSSEQTGEPWSPTTRMLVGTAGGAIVAFGMTQRFPVACALGAVGLGLVARAVTNFQIEEYLGMGGRHDESSDEAIRPEESRIPPPHMGRPPAMNAMSEQSSHATAASHSSHRTTRANSK